MHKTPVKSVTSIDSETWYIIQYPEHICEIRKCYKRTVLYHIRVLTFSYSTLAPSVLTQLRISLITASQLLSLSDQFSSDAYWWAARPHIASSQQRRGCGEYGLTAPCRTPAITNPGRHKMDDILETTFFINFILYENGSIFFNIALIFTKGSVNQHCLR